MAALIVLENNQVSSCLLDNRSIWLLGRKGANGKEGEIAIYSGIVSREHGELRCIENQWFYVDNPKNKNGTYHNGIKISRPISGIRQPVLLEDGDVLQMDGTVRSNLGVTMLFVTTPIQGEWSKFALNDRNITIGSGKKCELIVHGFSLDERSAKLSNVNGQYFLTNCGQTPACLNGKPVAQTTLLQIGDAISLNNCYLFFLGDKLIYTRIRKETLPAKSCIPV